MNEALANRVAACAYLAAVGERPVKATATAEDVRALLAAHCLLESPIRLA